MPFDITPASGLATDALATDAYARLTRFFSEIEHRPSREQWEAVRDLLEHLQRAADGCLDEAIYVSAIPAGTAKSRSLAAFAGALMDNPNYQTTGMLITVNRISEAKDMATSLASRTKLCVITSDPDANALGCLQTANEAQVCICTQEALKRTLKALAGAPFAAASRFHYRGSSRAVVTWDESFSFNRPATLDARAVLGLAKTVAKHSEAAADALVEWSLKLTRGTDGIRSVPDFAELGVDFYRLEDEVGDQDELLSQAKALSIMSGGRGFSTRGDYNAPTLITHFPELPPSLMPLVVTDASALVNPSYAQMALKWPVVRLKQARKTYRNMSIRIVPTAASRSVYRDKSSYRGRELIDMAVRYIRSVVPEPVLVISYKSRMAIRGVDQPTISEAIDARLTDNEKWIDKDTGLRRVSHLTWGKHTASNDYKSVRRVILMGLNYLPRPTGHAAAGAALDLDLLTEHPTADQIEEMRVGMLKDATLQAILRGNARMGVDGDCGVMEVVLPQVRQTGLAMSDYRDMFPGVVISQDRVLLPQKPLKGRLKDLATIAARRLTAGETELTNQSLYEELGMSKQQFAALVKRCEWQDYVAAVGLRPQPLKGRMMGLRLIG